MFFLVGARNVAITPIKEIYHLEDVLTCTAVGNPSLSYTWRKFRTNETIEIGPYLALNKTRIDVDQCYTIECVVQNNVAGEDKQSSAKVDVHVTVTISGNVTIALVKYSFVCVCRQM